MTDNTAHSIWTKARVEHLLALYSTGDYSCGEIAERLGGDISRNAVIGKLHRMGHQKPRAPKAAKRADKPIKAERKAAPPKSIRKVGQATYVPIDDDEPDTDPKSVAEIESRTPPATFRGIPFIDLEPQHCRYPRTVEGVTLYCGQVRIEDSSYCRDCHRCCHSRANYALNNVRRAA